MTNTLITSDQAPLSTETVPSRHKKGRLVRAAAQSTLIFSQDNRVSYEVDTLLLACWLYIPAWTEDFPSNNVQVFWVYDDASGNYIELGFFSGLMDFTIYFHDVTGNVNATGGSADLDTPQQDYFNLNSFNSLAISMRFSTNTMQMLFNNRLLDTSSVEWDFTTPYHMPHGAEITLDAPRYSPGIALGDYRVGFNEPFFDLTNSANTAKLWASDNTPVDWGPYGDFITGVQPAHYLSGNATTYPTNYGYRGPWIYETNSTPLEDFTNVPGPGCEEVPPTLPETPDYGGAVFMDGTNLLWNFPSMVDSPTGTLSLWLYVDNLNNRNVPPYPADGDMYEGNTGSIIWGSQDTMFTAVGRNNAGPTDSVPPVNVISITSANPAVVVFDHPHGIVANCWVFTFFFGQPVWSTQFEAKWIKVLSVTSTTMTLAFDASSLPPFIAGDVPGTNLDNYQGMFQPANSSEFYFQINANDAPWAFFSSTTSLPPRTWINMLVSWDLGHPAGNKIIQYYYGDNPVTIIQKQDSNPAFSIPYSTPDTFFSGRDSDQWLLFSHQGQGIDSAGMTCYTSEFWFAPGQFVDFTDSANRAKFHDSNGKPVYLGSDGSTPTGTVPALYLTTPRTAPADMYSYLNLPVRVMNMRYGEVDLPSLDTSSHTLVFSIWIWGDVDWEFTGDQSRNVDIQINYGYVDVNLYDAGGSNHFRFTFTYPPPGLKNIRFAVNTNHPIGSKVVNAYVNNSMVPVTVENDTVDNLLVNWTDSYGFDLYCGGFFSEFWLAPNQFFDPVNKFISGGSPVDLGSNGQLPSGTSPSWYITVKGTEPASAIENNRGIGGSQIALWNDDLFELLPNASAFLKNNAGVPLHSSSGYETFNLAPTNPLDDA